MLAQARASGAINDAVWASLAPDIIGVQQTACPAHRRRAKPLRTHRRNPDRRRAAYVTARGVKVQAAGLTLPAQAP